MSGRFAGTLALAGVLIAAAGITAGATVLPEQQAAGPVTQVLATSRSAPTLVCPGPETLNVPDGGRPADPGAPVVITALLNAGDSAAARVAMLGRHSATAKDNNDSLPSDAVTITRGRRLSLSTARPATVIKALATTALGPAVLSAPATDGVPTLAALQSTVAHSGDLRGLITSNCTAATTDTWLVGGGTVTGERLRLLLANPAGSPAVVDVDVRGPDGRVSAPSGDGVVVPAEGEVPIYIDALAPGLERVAVHVTARSGRVFASLHDSITRGLAPGGADSVQATAAPARRQVISGVSLVDGYSKTAGDSTAAGSTSVRIAVPGAEEAVVRIRLLDSSGEVELPQAAVAAVPASSVVDVPISGIPSGTYTALVESDVPVVAGALVGRGGTAGTSPASEFGWATASVPLRGSGYSPLPPATRSTLSLAAPGAAGRLVVNEVHSDGTTGQDEEVSIPAAGAATVQLSKSAVAVELSGFGGGPVSGSIVAVADDPRGTLISVLPLTLSTPAAAATTAVHDPRLGR